jgi:non-homologous end joining protein Ku
MRSTAKATLSLGLISCPVAAYTLVEKPASNRTVCDSGHTITGVRQRVFCPSCNSDGPFKKAREVATDQFVILDDADLAAAGAEADRFKGAMAINVHPAEQVTRFVPAGDKIYSLGPQKGGEDVYALFVGLVANHPELVFTTVFATRSVPAMYQLRIFEDRLALVEVAWPDAIKELPNATGTADANLAQMAEQFLTTMVTNYDPSAYRNTAKDKIDAAVAAGTVVAGSASSGTPAAAPKDPATLMAELQAAVAAAGGTPPTPITKAPSKRRTTRKAS